MEIYEELPEVRKIAEEEEEHEHELLNLIAEEHLDYVGSIVLGLNDALVELTGTLAGLTFALQNTRLIALAGLITGIAASFSMGASEYLSTKAEGTGEQEPFKSAVYTWIAYLITVAALILPYLLLTNYLLSLGITLLVGILIILFFNFYISVVRSAFPQAVLGNDRNQPRGGGFKFQHRLCYPPSSGGGDLGTG